MPSNLSAFKKRLPKDIGNWLFLLGLLIFFLSLLPIISGELWYMFRHFKHQEYVLTDETYASYNDSVFSRLLTSKPILLTPVNKSFSLIIEKIGVNVPVVANVPITDTNAYLSALKDGVAHASLSPYPSKDAGNTYIFAHASLNFWQLGKYATVFNLLRKLDYGDEINIFYEDKRYVYSVMNKEVVKGWNTYPITRPTLEPILTLQTCDPPGTTLNRLIVTAKLVEVID